MRRLVLTASGGPFRGRSRDELGAVTPAEALAHPTWDMGRVVTTNSATLVNKGLEVIEAHLLFDVAYDRIAVTV
ncbi:1-deoxy-D-xylulose 5-phosphate reductoisomerase, partial [Microbacterium sp. SUBG005]